jgi:hypothetical protein
VGKIKYKQHHKLQTINNNQEKRENNKHQHLKKKDLN